MGVVVTSTTELDTLVYSNDVIQEAKWNANKSPAAVIFTQSVLEMVLISIPCFRQIQGVMITEANPSRSAAITSDGISRWAYRINNEADETARIPIIRIKTGDFMKCIPGVFGRGCTSLDKGDSTG